MKITIKGNTDAHKFKYGKLKKSLSEKNQSHCQGPLQ